MTIGIGLAVTFALPASASAAGVLSAIALPASNGTYWNSVNDSNQVVGNYYYPGAARQTAVIWQDGALTELATPPNSLTGVNPTAVAIDDAGEVFGGYSGADDADTSRGYPVLWSPSGAATLPPTGQYDGLTSDTIYPPATSASSNGNTAAYWCGNNGQGYTPCQYVYALAPSAGTQYQFITVPLSFPSGGFTSGAIAINNAGALAVGYGSQSELFPNGAFGGMQPASINLAGKPFELNDKGDVVGTTTSGAPAIELADGTVTTLPLLHPGDTATPTAINDSDEVVGNDCSGGTCIPVAWINGTVATLSSLITGGFTGVLGSPVQVTDQGSILVRDTHNGAGLSYLLEASTYEVSGALSDQQCGEDSCSQTGIAGQDVLLTGKDAGGNAFSRVVTSAADGTWSVQAPPGSYTAGPVQGDGVTFVGPAFDPETLPVTVDSAAVPDINFAACAQNPDVELGAVRVPVGLSPTSDGLRSLLRGHNSGTFTESLCKSQYTLTLSARIPQAQIVDPSHRAPYDRSTDPRTPSYEGETGAVATAFYGRGLDSVLEHYPKYPACFSKHQLEHMAEERVALHWYSYVSGHASLGKVTIPLVWNQTAQKVYFSGAPSRQNGSLTRVWKYYEVKYEKVAGARGGTRMAPVREYGKCSVTAPIAPLYFVLPGGADQRGLVNGNAFTVVALWYIPFEPSGEVVPPGTSAEAALEHIFGEKLGGRLVESYESLPWPLHFGFVAGLATGGVGALEGAAAAATKIPESIKAAAAVTEALERAGNIAEMLHHAHSVWDVAHGGGEAVAGIVGGLLGKDGYPVMGAVLRGKFTTVYGDKTGVNKYTASTTLALSVVHTDFPDLSLTIDRQAKPNNSSLYPVTNGPLPWQDIAAGSPTVWNPFHANPAGLIGHSTASYERGEHAVSAIFSATEPLASIGDEVRETGSVETDLAKEQAIAQPPACDPATGRADPINAPTMCFVWQDGRP